ncbi:AraC family transcriptional regulator [Myroides sp. DF42-4-2]|uniref:helix-turn-helix domain-containing protein n=1 Tax=unclassified Myroides TaxID=2642485 RepID=UPI00257793A8|nr:AraC family transcriptional regulator [Myroides sp. DF42-4-2]MDM1407044.1 helix-turn-helix transcriptional regulator [Myroides sp. DF42-4-2]
MSITISKKRVKAFIEALEELSKGNYTRRLDLKVEQDCFSQAEVLFNILAGDYENKFNYFISLQPTLGYEFVTTTIIKISAQGQILDISLIQGNQSSFDKTVFIDHNVLDFLEDDQQEKWMKNFLLFIQTPAHKNSFSLQLALGNKKINGFCGFHYMDQSHDIWMSFALVIPIVQPDASAQEVSVEKMRKMSQEERKKIQKIHDLISNKNYEKIYTIEELCQLFDLSKNAFQKGFKLLYNQTFYTYYLTKRMEYAQQLLIYSDLSSYAIAEKCGFSDYSNFFRNFQKLVQCSPAQYRKQHYKGLKIDSSVIK